MFDLITGTVTHIPRNPRGPILVSTAAQLFVVALLVAVPVIFVTQTLPQPPTMMAFVAAPPPPPPPPPPAPVSPAKKLEPVTPEPSVGHFAAPLEAPPIVAAEPGGEDAVSVPEGVEGGVPGGVVGGVVGGLPEALPPPPPPPPPPPAPSAPVRVGGKIQPPTLIRRVEPAYPPMAVSAHLQGIVILEAIVNEEGIVTEVKVLRSVNPLLDREAVNAVRQWRYAPVILNGTPVKFVLSVSLSFSLQTRE
jgi:periplasmic protein TonB